MDKLLETNIVIDHLRGNSPEISEKIINMINEGITLTITQITASELWYGVYNLRSKKKQIAEAKKLNEFLLNLIEIKTLDNDSSKIYGEICAELERDGLRVPKFDLLNASIAIANKFFLITRDKKHFPRINKFTEFDFLELWD